MHHNIAYNQMEFGYYEVSELPMSVILYTEFGDYV